MLKRLELYGRENNGVESVFGGFKRKTYALHSAHVGFERERDRSSSQVFQIRPFASASPLAWLRARSWVRSQPNKTGFIRKDVLACRIPMLSRVPLMPVQNRLSTCFASHSTAEVSRGTGKNSARMTGMFQWKDPARLMRPPNARQTKHGFAKTRMGAAFVQDKDSSPRALIATPHGCGHDSPTIVFSRTDPFTHLAPAIRVHCSHPCQNLLFKWREGNEQFQC